MRERCKMNGLLSYYFSISQDFFKCEKGKKWRKKYLAANVDATAISQ